MINDNNNLASKIDFVYIDHVLENDFECALFMQNISMYQNA